VRAPTPDAVEPVIDRVEAYGTLGIRAHHRSFLRPAARSPNR
jgi:hypothetical protein